MARRNVEIELKANTRAAVRELDKLEKAAKDTDDALTDAESAGKKMAKAIDRAADDMIDEIDATARAVDKLETALGDVDADPREIVADLKRMGLTAQEIEDDVDDLAAAMKRVDDVKIRAKDAGFDDLDQALGSTTDNSRMASTAIGGIGNSLTELPGAESLGPVNEAMGMLAENVLEGEGNMKGLVAAGAGLAALGYTVQQIQGHFEKVAAIDAFNEEQVDAYVDSLREASTVLDGIEAKLREQEGVIVNWFGEEEDITKSVNAAGLNVEQFTKLVEEGNDAIDDWAKSLEGTDVNAKALDVTVYALKQEANAYRAAQDAANASTKFFGEDAAMSDRQVDRLRQRVDQYITSLDGIPTVKSSRIEALMDQGKYSEAKRLLDELTRPRSVLLQVGRGVSSLAPQRAVDSGGVIAPGASSLVAERRPEYVNGQLVASPSVATGPARVTSGHQTDGMLNGGTRTGGNTFITVNAPAGIDLDYLQRQAYRRTGRPV